MRKKDVFGKLRVLRKNIADEKGVAAFVIFPDTALKEMAKKVPVTNTQFLDIKGVGLKKLDDMGKIF